MDKRELTGVINGDSGINGVGGQLTCKMASNCPGRIFFKIKTSTNGGRGDVYCELENTLMVENVTGTKGYRY